jgi:hypothetical protein
MENPKEALKKLLEKNKNEFFAAMGTTPPSDNLLPVQPKEESPLTPGLMVHPEVAKRQNEILAEILSKDLTHSEIWINIQLVKGTLSSLYDWVSRIEDDFLSQNKIKGRIENIEATPESLKNMEESCKALRILIGKTILDHKERMALLFIYSKFGKTGEKRLHQILSKTSNYSFEKTQDQIDRYKSKGELRGISCEKLREWGICQEDCIGKPA